MILRNTSATISATLTVDGDDTDPTPDSATVAIYREDGTELVEETAAADGGEGIFTFALTPTHTEQLDVLRAVWKLTLNGEEQTLTTHHEIVGGFIAPIGAISRAIEGTAPSDAELRQIRSEAEQWLERACGVAFRPRYARDELTGDGSITLLSPRPQPISVIKAMVDGDVVEDVVARNECFRLDAGWRFDSDVEIAYEHGYLYPPEPVVRAAVRLAAHYSQNADTRISRFREDDQEVFFVLPGQGHSTGLPEVDAVVESYGYASVG